MNQWRIEDAGYETPCWMWTGFIHPHGYGAKNNGWAHRWSYEQHIGPIPEGLQIDHLCRNRACVNPGHLEAVTQAENIRRGSHTKLSHELVQQIREDAQIELENRQAQGKQRRSLGWLDAMATKYGVHRDTVKDVVNGRAWS